MKKRTRLPNPDEQDIAANESIWWQRFWKGYNHASYGAILITVIGIVEVLFFSSFILKIMGIILVGTGVGIFTDELSHLFTN